MGFRRLACTFASACSLGACSSYAPATTLGETTDAGATVVVEQPKLDAGVDASVPDEEIIHVSVQGTDAGADGSRERPFRSLAAALSLAGTARTAGAVIHVCQGEYAETRLSVRTPLTVEGSFDCSTWVRGDNPAVSQTVVRGIDPDASGLLDIAVADDVAVRIAMLELRGASNATRRSAATVRAEGSAVVLEDLNVVSPTGASVRAALLSGGRLSRSTLSTRGGTAIDHYGSTGLTVVQRPVRVDAVSITVEGTRCIAIEMGAGAELELRSVFTRNNGCTHEGRAVGGAATSFDSKGSVFWVSSPPNAVNSYVLALNNIGRVRSVDDRVLAELTAPGSVVLVGAFVDSPDAVLDNLLVSLRASTAIGLSIKNSVQVRHATVALFGTEVGSAIEFHDRAASPSSVDSSLLACLGCSLDASRRQAFAWPLASQVRNNTTRGFTRESLSADGLVANVFSTWSPSNRALACNDLACGADFVEPNANHATLVTRGLPLADTASCAIAQSETALLEPAQDAAGTPRTAPASVGAHEHDGACVR